MSCSMMINQIKRCDALLKVIDKFYRIVIKNEYI